jgi:hypothetical protein
MATTEETAAAAEMEETVKGATAEEETTEDNKLQQIQEKTGILHSGESFFSIKNRNRYPSIPQDKPSFD